MYIAICDDQAEELLVVTELLTQWQSERNIAVRFKEFRSAVEMLEEAQNGKFNLYLLDIMMSGMDGLSAAKEIRNFDENADIVFLTSSPNFALESYGVHALDYLLKPVCAEALFPVLDRVFQREQKLQEGLTVRCGSALVRIPFSQLVYVEVSEKQLYFNLTNGQTRKASGTMQEYESLLLAQPEFMRVHRSYIVNMLHVAELSATQLQTVYGEAIPVSRRLYPKLQNDYINLLFMQKEG